MALSDLNCKVFFLIFIISFLPSLLNNIKIHQIRNPAVPTLPILQLMTAILMRYDRFYFHNCQIHSDQVAISVNSRRLLVAMPGNCSHRRILCSSEMFHIKKCSLKPMSIYSPACAWCIVGHSSLVLYCTNIESFQVDIREMC